MPAFGRAESRTRKQRRYPGLFWPLIGIKAQVEQALHPEGFYFRVRLGTFERRVIARGGLPKWDGPTKLTGEFGENSLHQYRGEKMEKPHQQNATSLSYAGGRLWDRAWELRLEAFALIRWR